MRVLGGRYRLVEPVGQGGMAVVWRAEDELLHRTVAVKLLAPELASDRRSRELIRAEAYAAARLNHPHIANVYDYGETRVGGYRRTPYLVMEFVQGETLAARLHADGALDWPQAVRVCADVAAALAAAHAEGLVHRDVKPANVLLSPRGVKLVDLGIALAVGQRSIGEQGEVLGTPRYMAPEQVNGDAAAPASDVYGLGLLLHECLTGRPLRQGATLTELFARDHLADILSDIDVPGLPEAVDQLRLQCLSPEPADRPGSAEAAALLAAVAAGRLPAAVAPV
ncbi:serine/threonine-protein kinase, partial [Micromonospora sp. CPCC 205711]|uniref:serine/threonine-protein kinase n=1 Tax=Micromonospora sp. CPCC 205547 TaxID=3122400 RepID=UPI002FEEB966